MSETIDLPKERRNELLNILKNRFEENMHRHEGMEWEKIAAKLEERPEKLRSLHEMEKNRR